MLRRDITMSCSSQAIFCVRTTSGSKTYRPISSSHEQVGQTRKTNNEMLTESLHLGRPSVSSLLWLEFRTDRLWDGSTLAKTNLVRSASSVELYQTATKP